MTTTGPGFTGSLASVYEAHLVPLIFESYAADTTARLVSRAPTRVLEVAAGTGVVTRALARALPGDVSIVASDLSQPMLDQAMTRGTERPVEWRQADAMQLPFDDRSFDAVVCQFGAMFFPDKGKAFSEARRVLRPGGVFLFNVWDSIVENEFADAVTNAMAERFPADPPRFLVRTPYGYFDRDAIRRDLAAGGFTAAPALETVQARSRAASPREPALAFCQGTPLRTEIEARDASGLAAATAAAESAVAARFGSAAVDARIQAHVVVVSA